MSALRLAIYWMAMAPIYMVAVGWGALLVTVFLMISPALLVYPRAVNTAILSLHDAYITGAQGYQDWLAGTLDLEDGDGEA
jgi:hypothetical protein